MSTIFSEKFKNMRGQAQVGEAAPPPPQEMRCFLCAGELYPGDPYFELDGRAVCEDCLGRYARCYFAPRLRRVGWSEKETL